MMKLGERVVMLGIYLRVTIAYLVVVEGTEPNSRQPVASGPFW
jgi:hypothetical protein